MIWFIGNHAQIEVPISTPVIDTVFIPTPIQTITPVHVLHPFIYSWYYPDAGGPNCGSPLKNGHCTERMGGSGLPWLPYVDIAVACPMEYKTGTKIHIVSPFQGDYVCLDHGGAIIKTSRGDWLDFLTKKGRLLPNGKSMYGTIIYGWVEEP